MKLEKLYKDIFEVNVGDKLFADMDAAKTAAMNKGFSKNFTKWVEQIYGPDYEINTPEEEKLFWALGNYFGDAGKGKELGKMVDDLKALKSQFPNMLNPTSTTLPNEGYAYRGAKLPIAQYEKLIRKSVPDWGTFTQHARVDNPGITYKSRGQYGFTSFTTDYEQAEKFANSWKEKGDYVNVVYGVKLDNPNLVVNPSFANRMSEYPEDETLYVGNSITPDVIAIVDPRFTANVLYDMKAYEEENDLPEFSIKVADFYPNWAKTHTPRLDDFNSDGTPKNKEDKKVRLDKKDSKEQAKIDKLKAMQAKKYGIKESISLHEVYTDLLNEIGNLDPSKALPYELVSDNTRSVPGEESGAPRFVKGKQEYAFHFVQDQDGYPSKKIMVVKFGYDGTGTMRIDFNPAGAGGIPILGDSYKSAYTIMNTVGAIVKQSLKDTLEKGITKTIVAAGKSEYDKKNPEQRQQMYTLFIKKAFPGAVVSKSGMLTTLPDDYPKYLNENEVYTEIQLSEVGEGTSEPFEYKENFRKGDTFSYLIDSYTEQDDLERSTPIRLQAIAYKERVSGDMEFARPEYFDFLDKPKGTILNGFEIIFRLMEGDSFAEVNDRVFMYRLMATIKKILQEEFAKSKPDILNYSPGKKGDEAAVDTGRHKLYNAFIKKAFPSAKVFVDHEEDEMIYKLK